MTPEQMENAIIRIDKNVTSLVERDAARAVQDKEIAGEINDLDSRVQTLEHTAMQNKYFLRGIIGVMLAIGGFIGWFLSIAQQILDLLSAIGVTK